MIFPAETPLFDAALFSQNARVLAACSGGADSMALLQMLAQNGFDIVAAHVNHGLRGEESDGDEKLVRDFCAAHAIPFASRHVEVMENGERFSESAAREKRYAALCEMAREYSRNVICTGHTATDNLETILMNLMRGAAVDGLCGIAPLRRERAEYDAESSDQSLSDAELLIARPLHRLTREQTRAFCVENKIPFRDDSSNASTRFRRNRVRAELLPLLAEISGKSESALALSASRGAALLRDDVAFLNGTAKSAMERIVLSREKHRLILCGARFVELNEAALQRRVLREAVREIGGDLREIGAARIEEMRLHIVAKKRRAVWTPRRDLRVEWTGEHGGNRVRLWRVEKIADCEL